MSYYYMAVKHGVLSKGAAQSQCRLEQQFSSNVFLLLEKKR